MGEEELLCTVPQLRFTDFTRPPYHILCQDHDSTENDGAAEQSKEQQQSPADDLQHCCWSGRPFGPYCATPLEYVNNGSNFPATQGEK